MFQSCMDNILHQTTFTLRKNPCDLEQFLDTICPMLFELGQKKKFCFIAGNGASQTIAEHFSADFIKAGKILTLSINGALYSALSNDLSFEDCLSKYIQLYQEYLGLVIVISSSGNSKNIVNALKVAKELSIQTMSLTGMNADNLARSLSDFSIHVDFSYYGEVESAHATLMHMILDAYLDKYQGGKI